MKKVALLFLLGLVVSCFMPARNIPAQDLLSNLSEEDRSQAPEIAVLPFGYFFAYKFSQELTDRQCYFMLALLHDISLDVFDVKEDDVIIFAYGGPERTVVVTADRANDEVEFWASRNDSDRYTRKLFQGDVVGILYYLSKGYEGNPVVTEGKMSEEINRYLGKRIES